MQCSLCLFNKYDEPHRCVGTVTVRKTLTGGYVAQLKDGLGDVKRECPHIHTELDDALLCGKSHYVKHQDGSCDCVYFKKPIPPHIYRSAKTQLYIIRNNFLFAWKIGVSGYSNDERLSQHLNNGWTLVAKWTGVHGIEAYRLEQETIQMWREKKFKPVLKSSDMVQGGATETVSFYDVDEENIEKLISNITGKLRFNPKR